MRKEANLYYSGKKRDAGVHRGLLYHAICIINVLCFETVQLSILFMLAIRAVLR